MTIQRFTLLLLVIQLSSIEGFTQLSEDLPPVRFSFVNLDARANTLEPLEKLQPLYYEGQRDMLPLPTGEQLLIGPFEAKRDAEVALFVETKSAEGKSVFAPFARFPVSSGFDGILLIGRIISDSKPNQWFRAELDPSSFGSGKLAVLNLVERNIAVNAAGEIKELAPGKTVIFNHGEQKSYRLEVKLAQLSSLGWEVAHEDVFYRYPEEQMVFLAYEPAGNLVKVALQRLPNFNINAQGVDPIEIENRNRSLREIEKEIGNQSGAQDTVEMAPGVPEPMIVR